MTITEIWPCLDEKYTPAVVRKCAGNLRIKAAALAADERIHRNILVSGITTLIISKPKDQRHCQNS